MVMVMDGGAELANESYLHGVGLEGRKFISNHFQALTPQLMGANTQFLDHVKAIEQNYLAYTTPLRLAVAAERQVTGLWTEDVIQDLLSMTQFQNAPPIMIQYLMADPTIRRAYHRQQLEGYGSAYVDEEPDNIGISHSTYRKVTDGMVLFTDYDGDSNPDWTATTWSLDEDDKLAFTPKASLLYSMRNLREAFLEGGEDPTSELNVRLT